MCYTLSMNIITVETTEDNKVQVTTLKTDGDKLGYIVTGVPSTADFAMHLKGLAEGHEAKLVVMENSEWIRIVMYKLIALKPKTNVVQLL